MLIAFPVLPLLASTMMSPGASSPSRSARSIMYLAIRALIDPDWLRYSSLTHIPSTMTRGVLPIASRIVPPPRPATPTVGFGAAPAAPPAAPSRVLRAAERALLVASMPAPSVAGYEVAGPCCVDPFPEDACRCHCTVFRRPAATIVSQQVARPTMWPLRKSRILLYTRIRRSPYYHASLLS